MKFAARCKSFRRTCFRQMPVVQCERPQKLSYVQGVAAAGASAMTRSNFIMTGLASTLACFSSLVPQRLFEGRLS
jgi:hypothetical protein